MSYSSPKNGVPDLSSRNYAESILNAGMVIGAPKNLPGGGIIVVAPDGTVHDVSGMAYPLAGFARAHFVATTPDSLVSYIRRHRKAETSVFADVARTMLVCFIDYHTAENGVGRAEHRAVYEAPLSREWKLWTGIDGRAQNQFTLARFLEENSIDVVSPPGADMLEIVKTLEAAKKVNFRQGIRLDNGNVDLLYKEETDGAAGRDGHLTIPTELELGIPVFHGGERYKVTAFFRYRLDEGKLALTIDIHRKQEILDHAFKLIIDKVKGDLGDETPVYEGSVTIEDGAGI